MADNSLKQLLVKLKLSTDQWQKYVKQLKTDLKDMQQQAMKDFAQRQQAAQKEVDQVKLQTAEQKKLRAEAEAMAAVDKAKAEWRRQGTEAIKQQTAEILKQSAAQKAQAAEAQNLVKQAQEQVRLEQMKLRLKQQQKAEEEKDAKKTAAVPSAAGTAAARSGIKAAAELEISKEQAAVMAKTIADGRAKLAVEEAQLRLMKEEGTVRKADAEALQKEIQQEKARLSVMEAQVRQQRGFHPGGGGGGFGGFGGGGGEGEEGGGGFLGGALMSLSSGLLGGGLPGMMMAGVAAGNALEKVMEKLGETVREFGKDALDSAGVAGQLREQFNKLASRSGADPEEFLNKLRIATRGLVEDNTQLIRVANNFMQGPLQMEPEQVAKLTEMTVALARAQGKDATEAMNALSRAALTGRTQMLSWELGLTRGEMLVRNLGRGVSETTREQLQLSMTMDAMQRRLAEVGTPMTTLKDLFSQLHMVQAAFAEDMAFGTTHSKAFSDAIQKVSTWLMKITPTVLDFALALGEKLGTAFAYLQPLLVAAGHWFEAMWGQLKNIGELIGTVIAIPFRQLMELFGAAGAKITPFRGALMALADALEVVSGVLRGVGNSVKLVTDLMDAASSMSLSKAKEAFKNYALAQVENMKMMVKGFQEQWKLAQQQIPTGLVETGTAGPKKQSSMVDPSVLNERRKLQMQLAEADAKAKLEMKKEEIQQEQEMEKQKYEQGLIDLQQYMQAQRQIEGENHQAKLQEIAQERDAKLAELKQEAQGQKDPMTGKYVAGMDPQVYQMKRQLIIKQANLQEEQEAVGHQKKLADITQSGLQDQLAAQREYASAVNKIQKEGVAEQTKILEDQFKSGEVGADEYLAHRKDLIEQDYDLTVQALQAEADANKQNAAEMGKIRIDMVNAEIAKEKELQDLEVKEGDIRLQAIQTRYNEAKEILQSGIDLNRAQMGMEGGTTQQADLSALLDITKQHIVDLQTEQERLEEGGEKYTEDWANVAKQISAATMEQVKLNTELAKAKDLAGPLGQMFGTIASEFRSLMGPNTASWLESLSKGLGEISKAQTGVAAQFGGMGGMVASFPKAVGTLFHPAKSKTKEVETAQQVFEKGLKSAADKADTFGKDLTATAGKVAQGADTESKKFNTAVDSSVTQLQAFAKAAQEAAARLAATGQKSETQGGDQAADVTVSAEAPEVPIDLATYGGSLLQEETGSSESTSGAGTTTEPETTDTSSGDQKGATGAATSGLQKFAAWLNKASQQGGQFSGALQQVVGMIGGMAQEVGGVVQSISGAKTTGGGIMSGGLSGMEMGAQFGGPVGAAVGGIAGAVMGGLVGSKQQQITQETQAINERLDAIKLQLQQGTQTLGGAIGELQSLRSSAVGELGGSKKGQKQLPQQLAAINDEINQLLEQQQQLLEQLSTQLGVLLEPKPYQDILQQLSQIVQQYQQFASAAAGSTSEMAEANAYLVASLQQYVQTQQNNVRAANEQAISDAEQLIDLQQQLNSYQLQEYNVLTQGVASRQMTTAENKGWQIAQIQYQEQQTQQEYNLQDYKVQAEQKMFNLATDRLGLEQQMVGLQEQDFDLQMQSVQAAMQTLAQLQSALGPGGQIPSSLLNATGGVSIAGLQQLLGLPVTATGPAGYGQPYIQNEPPIFQEFINTIDQTPGFQNFGQQLLAAAATPFGSSQRAAVKNQLTSDNWAIYTALEQAGLVSKPVNGQSYDPNWLNFFGWIMNQAQSVTPGGQGATTATPGLPGGGTTSGQPALPGLQEGGMVPASGSTDTTAAMLTPGEYVIPQNIFQSFITALNNFASVIQTYLTGNAALQRPGIGYQTGAVDSRMLDPLTVTETPLLGQAGLAVYPISTGGTAGAPVPVQSLIPGYAAGGVVPQTGPAMLHAGETVVPAGKSMSDVASSTQLSNHQAMFDLSQARVGLEMNLITAQQAVIAADNQRLNNWKQLLSSNGGAAGVVSLEGAFSKLYENRGRMGLGGFTREVL